MLFHACAQSIVGSGKAKFDVVGPEAQMQRVAFPTAPPPLTVVYGGVRAGAILLFAHMVVPALPAVEVAVARIELRRKQLGWIARVKVPAIGRGLGSLTDLSLKLGRRFVDRGGKRKSFLSAKCPDGAFRITMPKALFKNEARIPGVAAQTVLKGSLAIPCKPKG